MSELYRPHFAHPLGALIEKTGLGITLAAMAGAPTASAAGYAKGCIFQDTTNGNVYKNTGTSDSATWTALFTGAQGAALTAQSTSITHTAPGTPDFAIQNLVQNTGFGFVTADEGNTVLAVILNLQTRLAEVEARLEAAGLVAAN